MMSSSSGSGPGMMGLAGNPLFVSGLQMMSNSMPGPVYRPLMLGVPQAMQGAAMQAMMMERLERDREERERKEQERQRGQKAMEQIRTSMTAPYVSSTGPLSAESLTSTLLGGSPEQQNVALGLMTREPKDTRTTMQKNYEQAVAQGFPGTMLDYQMTLKPQPPQVSVSPSTTILPGEKESQILQARYYDDLYKQVQQTARDSSRRSMQYQLVDQLLGEAYTGFGGDPVQWTKKAARAFGIDLGEVAGPEAAAMVSNELALQLRNPAGGAGMPGAMSDKDRQFLQSMVPSLTTTAEGRRLMIEVQKRLDKRNQEIAKLARNYRLNNQQLDAGFEQAVADKFMSADLFGDLFDAIIPGAAGGGFNPRTVPGVLGEG